MTFCPDMLIATQSFEGEGQGEVKLKRIRQEHFVK
jgi:hypothetical protein